MARTPGPQTPIRTPDYEACLGAWALTTSARGCAFGFLVLDSTLKISPLKTLPKQNL